MFVSTRPLKVANSRSLRPLCSSFPAGLSVLTFHLPTEMLSLPLIFFNVGTPVASCHLTVGAVIVIPGCDRSGINVLLVFFNMVFLG